MIVSHKYLFIVVISCLISVRSVAQKYKSKNLPDFDRRRYHFGFTLGLNSANMELERSGPNNPNDSLLLISVDPQSGFNLGIVTSFNFNEYLKLRFIPSISFAQRNLEYEYNLVNIGYRQVIKPVESTYIDLPLLVKLKSARLNNFAAYIITGGKYSIDLVSDQNVDNEGVPDEEVVVKLKRQTYSYEIGVGTDFYLEYFKFGIEAKMSYTLGDVLIQDNTTFSTPLERLKPRMFLLSLTFEG